MNIKNSSKISTSSSDDGDNNRGGGGRALNQDGREHADHQRHYRVLQ